MTAVPRPALAAALASLLAAGPSACTQPTEPGSGPVTASPSSAATSSSPSPASTSPQSTSSPSAAAPSPSPEDEQEGTPIRIAIGDKTLEARIWDTPAGQALLDRLPLTLEFEDFNRVEKIGHLDEGLPMEGMPEGEDPHVGDLGYHAPGGNVVLYYGDVGYWDGIARLGTIHGDLSIIEREGGFTATLEAAE